jgi:hypothetical protein
MRKTNLKHWIERWIWHAIEEAMLFVQAENNLSYCTQKIHAIKKQK